MPSVRIAVVGGSGFIGSAVSDALRARGVGVSSIPAPRLTSLARSAARDQLANRLVGHDAVVNAAGISDALSSPHESLWAANALLPALIAEAASQAGLRLMVHISSAAVQGDREMLDSSTETRPLTPYARSKAEGERLLAASPMRTVVYRPPGVHSAKRAVTQKVARIARSPLSTVAGDAPRPTAQAQLENVADAIAFLALHESPPKIVHHPSEGITTTGLLVALGNGRKPRQIPETIARATTSTLKAAPISQAKAIGRRLEMLWFGQAQADSWLTESGWQPPRDSKGWRQLLHQDENGHRTKRLLAITTVAQSLVFQSPSTWAVARTLGYEITFASGEDGWETELGPNFVPIPNCRELSPRSLVATYRELRCLLAQDWDIILVQTPIVASMARLAASRTQRDRLGYVVHGFHFYPGGGITRWPYKVMEALLAHRSHMALVSAWDTDWVRRLPASLRPKSVTHLPGAGVDIARIAQANPYRDLGAPYILFVGELNKNKDPLFAIDVVRHARKRRPDLLLVLVGNGPLRSAVEHAAQNNSWIRYLASSRNVPGLMAGAEVLLAPSTREGVPRVIIEALATGTPVLAKANRGSCEILDFRPGWIQPVDSSASKWSHALEEILEGSIDAAELREHSLRYDTHPFKAAIADFLRAIE